MVELVYNYIVIFTEEEKEQFKSRLTEDGLKLFEYNMQIVKTIHKKGLHKADLNPKNIGKYKF